jgi:beta-1,4-mannosyl-glycoprotein beta-1,4-N-acetylglucosaminyltransferase
MIYNGFMFYDEVDMLDIRLNELWNTVDYFIIVECPTTHRNVPKPLYFEQNKERYAPFMSKIRHIVHELPLSNIPFENENEHRRGILKGLDGIRHNDYLIVTDADEIPRAETIRTYTRDCARLAMDFYYYFYNLRTAGKWGLAYMLRYGAMNKDINEYRTGQYECDILENAGWHFSKIYPLEEIKYKFQNALADELGYKEIIDNLEQWRNNGETHWCGHDVKFDKCEIDESYPLFFRQNILRFKDFLT